MNKADRKAVLECKAQIGLDLMFIKKAQKDAQEALDEINNKTQAITTRLINLEEYMS